MLSIENLPWKVKPEDRPQVTCELTMLDRGDVAVPLFSRVVGLSAGHVRRLARAGKIPGARRGRVLTPNGFRNGWLFHMYGTGIEEWALPRARKVDARRGADAAP